MSGIARVWLKVVRTDDGWKVAITCPGGPALSIERTMRRHAHSAQAQFPLPPDDDLPDVGAPQYALCTAGGVSEVREIRSRIASRTPEPNDVEYYGRYLFACLIGSCWAEIDAAAVDADLIELALCIADDGDPLHRMHWEMMHGPDSFLLSGTPRRVTVSRVVPDGTVPQQAGETPRVLFVIGKTLTDQKLRSGAEVVGLLQDIQRKGRSIHSHILQRASPETIRKALEAFRPHIVHFICHGNVDKNDVPYLELQTDEDEQEPRRDAGQLLTLLRLEDRLPAIVVLSACYSAASPYREGEPMNHRDAAPLAAHLVRGGIPIVVGMSGRVADLACRLFTRCFGEALVDGKPLVAAAEKGRRVAFSDGQSPTKTVDWAYPTLFLSELVAPEFVPFSTAGLEPFAALKQRFVKKLQLEELPVFCGRDDIFEFYYELYEGPRSVMAIHDEKAINTSTKIGRTRLLHELALQAVRDGHIPCLLSGRKPGWTPPGTLEKFAHELIEALTRARAALSLPRDPKTQLFQLVTSKDLDKLAQEPTVDDLLKQKLLLESRVSVAAVQAALCADLEKLREDATAEDPRFSKGRTIVLLDDVHEFNDVLPPLLNELGPEGFALPEREGEIVPVVMALSLNSPASHILRKFIEEPRGWLRSLELTKFREGENILAYERVLLHPYAEDLWPEYSDRPWVRNLQAKEADVDQLWHSDLRKYLSQFPSDFYDRTFYSVVMSAARQHLLMQATDDDLLEQLWSEL